MSDGRIRSARQESRVQKYLSGEQAPYAAVRLQSRDKIEAKRVSRVRLRATNFFFEWFARWTDVHEIEANFDT